MPPARCAAHPGRPAVDLCPVCERPRCGADAVSLPGAVPGCRLCRAVPLEARSPAASDLERLVCGTLAASAVALLWGLVTSEYVGAEYFQYLSPLVLGLLAGGFATAAAKTDGRGVLGIRVRLVAVLYAVLGTAFGFVHEGTYDALAGSTDVLVPYVIAAAGAWLYTLPPKARTTVRKASPGA